MIHVVNKHTYTGPGVYIGRPSPLGNPFHIGPTCTRAQSIAKHETWFRQEFLVHPVLHAAFKCLVERYYRTGTLTLICWCAPEPCHGDTLAKIIKEILRDRMP